eukprot:TRINITY_DN36375_c0_g1_i1.p1 TRINITY_DN36375_c0_g1~~TRINITY_DN36375_c0_g1_i1.p1  ORF type:complete len:392 (+),score=86.23 TRINITY_DN36375_c0_g1_i1:251-1426(+)
MVLLMVTKMLLVAAVGNAASVRISVLPGVISTTEPTYASWNIDSSCNRGFHQIDFSNKNLLAAATALYPSRLRFGGSGNDNLVYGLSEGSPECRGVAPTGCGYFDAGCLNASHWDKLWNLANLSGTEFIFGVSYGLDDACRQGRAYVWNASNAGRLLEYLRARRQTVWGFELGNEVNNNAAPPCNQTPPQQAHAQKVFSGMVAAAIPSAKLIGPDSGAKNPLEWLEGYLPLVSGLHAVTQHVYGGMNRKNFNNATQLDKSATEIGWYTQTLRKLAPGAQIWAGENGPTGGGNDGTCGRDSACGTYATTLWYADDLGMRAQHGFAQYQRQDLFGAYYGLTNSRDAKSCLLYTSDAADEEDSVDLGGRRIIKKKKKRTTRKKKKKKWNTKNII